jgi:hypothetical protein
MFAKRATGNKGSVGVGEGGLEAEGRRALARVSRLIMKGRFWGQGRGVGKAGV